MSGPDATPPRSTFLLFLGGAGVVVGIIGGFLCTIASLIYAFDDVASVEASERAAALSDGISRAMTLGVVGGGAVTLLGAILLGIGLRRAWSAKGAKEASASELPRREP